MHIPVLFQETLLYLQPKPGGSYIDGTLGAGGHTKGLLEASKPDGRVLAFDRDPEAISYVQSTLPEAGNRAILIQGSYVQMAQMAPALGFSSVDGILLDLGFSSRQMEEGDRGFSFRREGPLDMRFDQTSSDPSAAELIDQIDEAELAEILKNFGEVRQSRRLAKAIISQRPITSTRQLTDLVVRELGWPGRGSRKRRIHPATLVFQALRIAVNRELEMLEAGLEAAVPLLKPGGRLAVISFHSLEDRQVKRFIREQSRECICPSDQPICTCDHRPTLRPVTGKVIKSSEEEITSNPRSRSARLRVAEKLTSDET